MTARLRDPSSMTPEERLAELGEILATRYRFLRKALAAFAEPEAQCSSRRAAQLEVRR